ncbi:MAG: STAS domain-containing protein [Burkholderiales bacterium]|nr:STAS domain-containing protein [Betaproteobacteria bacterium]
MIDRDGDRFRVHGPLTLRSAAALLRRGRELFNEPVSRVDLAGVGEIDSAALGLLIEWLREARAHKREIVYLNLPANLESLGTLYGVLDLLPRAEARAQTAP